MGGKKGRFDYDSPRNVRARTMATTREKRLLIVTSYQLSIYSFVVNYIQTLYR